MKSNRNTHLDRILGRLEDLDTTNLTALVQRLARERRLLETVFNTIHEGIVVVDEQGIIQYANRTAHTFIGLKEEEVGQALLFKLVPDLARTMSFKFEDEPVATVISREFELTYPEHRFVRFYMVPFTVGEGKEQERQYAVIMTDITEAKISTEEQLESERLSSIFMLAAGVAHEIGNPLNSINIHLQIILRQLKKIEQTQQRDKIADSVEVCRSEVERLDGIVKHFLEAIRPSEPNLVDTDLLELLESVLAFVAQETRNAGISVELSLGERPPLIHADKDQVRQVFFNVLKNAREAMQSGGTIRVSTRTDDEFVYLYVADDGVGIDEEELASVFQPYKSNKKGGHGLGMMVCQRIMREHGGQIGIDSRKGTGTVVTLQFPQKHRRIRLLEDQQAKA